MKTTHVCIVIRNRQHLVVGRHYVLENPEEIYGRLLCYQPMTAHSAQCVDMEGQETSVLQNLYEFLTAAGTIRATTIKHRSPALTLPNLPAVSDGLCPMTRLIERVISSRGQGITPDEVQMLVGHIFELEDHIELLRANAR